MRNHNTVSFPLSDSMWMRKRRQHCWYISLGKKAKPSWNLKIFTSEFEELQQRRHFHNTLNQPFVVLLVTMSSFASVLVSLWHFLLLCRFMDNLQTEMLEIEFLSYSRGLPTISEEDFARILLRYTNVDDVSGYLENVRHSIPDEKVILYYYYFFFAGSLCGHIVPLTAVILSPNVHKVDKITVTPHIFMWCNTSETIQAWKISHLCVFISLESQKLLNTFGFILLFHGAPTGPESTMNWCNLICTQSVF